MNQTHLTLAYFFILTLPLTSQNLIPNPSFEQCNRVVNNWMGNHKSFERASDDWFVPNKSSPDLLQRAYLGKMFEKRPKINLATYAPRSGDVMIGLKCYGCEDGQHCKEYVEVQLKQPLTAGKNTIWSFGSIRFFRRWKSIIWALACRWIS